MAQPPDGAGLRQDTSTHSYLNHSTTVSSQLWRQQGESDTLNRHKLPVLKRGDGTQAHAAGIDVSTKSTCQTKMCYKTKVRPGLYKKAVNIISSNCEICKSWFQF